MIIKANKEEIEDYEKEIARLEKVKEPLQDDYDKLYEEHTKVVKEVSKLRIKEKQVARIFKKKVKALKICKK